MERCRIFLSTSDNFFDKWRIFILKYIFNTSSAIAGSGSSMEACSMSHITSFWNCTTRCGHRRILSLSQTRFLISEHSLEIASAGTVKLPLFFKFINQNLGCSEEETFKNAIFRSSNFLTIKPATYATLASSMLSKFAV